MLLSGRTLYLLLAGSIAAAPITEAQEVGFEIMGGRASDERGAVHPSLSLAPSLTWAGEESTFRLRAQATLFPTGVAGALGAQGAFRAAGWGPVDIVLAGEGAGALMASDYRIFRGAVEPVVRFDGSRWGIEAGPWLALGAEPGEMSFGRPIGLLSREGAREAGALRWRSASGISAGAWGEVGIVSVRARWQEREADAVSWQEWSGSASVGVGAITAALSGGRRTSGQHDGWMAMSMEIRMNDRLSLMAIAGAYPSDPLTGVAAGRVASAGVTLRAGRSRSMARAPGTGAEMLRSGPLHLAVRAVPGARVEVLAEWTEWQPYPVPEARPGEYVLEVVLPPGIYRFLFRVDGERRIPEGFPTERDDFGGEHAVVRVGG